MNRAPPKLLFQLGERYYHQGRWELAAEAFQMVADRYGQHPLAGAALVWLVQYYASGEAAWRIRQTDRLTAEQVTAVEPARAGRWATMRKKPIGLPRPCGDRRRRRGKSPRKAG